MAFSGQRRGFDTRGGMALVEGPEIFLGSHNWLLYVTLSDDIC